MSISRAGVPSLAVRTETAGVAAPTRPPEAGETSFELDCESELRRALRFEESADEGGFLEGGDLEEAVEAAGMGGVKERGWNWIRFFLAMGYRGASEPGPTPEKQLYSLSSAIRLQDIQV
ncbi:hypothetical protein F2Q69_00059238 [Brassica cretica]|uniref:Uncharacterized protein n=1 Tax=Brassica cretica TaxID=69181 RepID=A0A8S9RHW5_BRACR|nr:hypothetical protein F2Q69_00059238 [Brassica cretica]